MEKTPEEKSLAEAIDKFCRVFDPASMDEKEEMPKTVTLADIKKALACCADSDHVCRDNCIYDKIVEYYPDCKNALMLGALAYIQQLEEQVPRWVSVEERLPERTGKYIVCTTKRSVYCTRFKVHSRGGDFQRDINTHIAHWMPMPEAPKEDAHE